MIDLEIIFCCFDVVSPFFNELFVVSSHVPIFCPNKVLGFEFYRNCRSSFFATLFYFSSFHIVLAACMSADYGVSKCSNLVSMFTTTGRSLNP